jgi:hypothetical protein
MFARMVHEDPPHQLGRNRKEVNAIVPVHRVVTHEPQIGFMH